MSHLPIRLATFVALLNVSPPSFYACAGPTQMRFCIAVTHSPALPRLPGATMIAATTGDFHERDCPGPVQDRRSPLRDDGGRARHPHRGRGRVPPGAPLPLEPADQQSHLHPHPGPPRPLPDEPVRTRL